MTALKNIKIGGKLVIGFGILLILTVIITVFGIFATISTDTGYSDVLDYPIARYNTLRSVDFDLMDIRRIVALAALNVGDHAALDGLERELNANRARITSYVQSFNLSLDQDPIMDSSTINERRVQIRSLENLIYQYIDGVATDVLALARAGQQATGEQAQALNMINHAMGTIFSDIYTEFYVLLDEMQLYVDNISGELSDGTYSTIYLLVALAVISVILGVAVALLITRLITRPVGEVMNALESVAHGNLNVNIRTDAKDETGVLAKSAQTLVSTLQRLITEMDNMANDHERGEIDTFINTSMFEREFQTVAEKINNMLSSAIETQDKVVGTFMEIADGNFAADMEKLPGKKAKLNAAVDDMRKRIEAVSGEINFLIDAAAKKGDLAVHIDEKKYSGGWRDIMEGLNNLAAAIDKPIVEIRDVMARFSEGYFDKSIEGDYPGDFLVLKNAVNAVVADLSDYVHEIDDCLSDIAGGNLTHKTSMKFNGEFIRIGESINNISDTLHKTMSEIDAASEQVLSGAKQISTSAMDLANGASEQASSVQELSASIDLINQQTQQNAASADDANQLSSRSSEDARSGNDAMKQMLDAMGHIEESSKNVAKINKVIQDIAFQTNLLSLNAAVEAARAGEHGKGFAVVAEEVRNLAARSQESATETTNLINESINYVGTGSEIAETTAKSLDLIVSSSGDLLNIIQSISVASKDQAEAVSQVSIGLQQISSVVQSNSAVSEETAAASEELNSQAELLRQLVSYFKL